jgi:Limonene-1,2-epoxide hydrolase catalytic domain
VHAISADGPSVLTERTDVLKFRRLRIQFWVCGRFDVHDGQIVLWRDYFDHLTVLAATVRGLVGTVFPAVRAKPPINYDARRRERADRMEGTARGCTGTARTSRFGTLRAR